MSAERKADFLSGHEVLVDSLMANTSDLHESFKPIGSMNQLMWEVNRVRHFEKNLTLWRLGEEHDDSLLPDFGAAFAPED